MAQWQKINIQLDNGDEAAMRDFADRLSKLNRMRQ